MNGVCPNRNELQSYATGMLPEAQVADLEQHLSLCSECSQITSDFEDEPDDFLELLRNSADMKPDVALTEPEFLSAVELIVQRRFTDQRSTPIAGDATQTIDGNSIAESRKGRLQKINRPPESLGQYDLLEQIGRGGMGVVYKARHRKLNCIVALKVLPESLTSDETTLNRFENEMRAIGSLNHPNIVRAHDADEVDGTHLLVMDYVDGENLSSMIKRRGPLPVKEACGLILQAARGLQHIHEAGMVHRDIKPGNLMVSDDGGVRILDLGLALLAGVHQRPPGEGITATGQVMGTLNYIAPEQADDSHTVDIRADIYSLGATLYALLAGMAPFADRGAISLLQKLKILATEDPTPISSLNSNVSPALEKIVAKSMARNPDQRYATPAEMMAAIHDMNTGMDHSTSGSFVQRYYRQLICFIPLMVLCILFVRYQSEFSNREVTSASSNPDAALSDLQPLAMEIDSSPAPATDIRQERDGIEAIDERWKASTDNTNRSALIHSWNSAQTTVEVFLDELRHNEDGSIRAAMWQMLGQFAPEDISEANRAVLSSLLLQQFMDDSNPEVHSSILWLVGHWKQSATALKDRQFLERLSSELTSVRHRLQLRPVPYEGGWFETLHNETMVVVPAGASYTAGSPASEPGREDDASDHSEIQHSVSLPYAFAACATEVTKQQFSNMWWSYGKPSPHGQSQHPITGVTWQQAAWYCNRRSELEGFSAEEYCYESINGQSTPPEAYRLKPNYQSLGGYRMLNEAEWEYCCRGGTTTGRYFGADDRLAKHYMVVQEGGFTTPQPVQLKKPNAFGFFDMLGNAAEWVNDAAQVTRTQTRRVRGGSATTGFTRTRAAVRLRVEQDYPHPMVGFRIGRTIHKAKAHTQSIIAVDVHNSWYPIADTTDFDRLSDDWQKLADGQQVCLGTGTRTEIPRRWFRLRNTSDEALTVEPCHPSGNAICIVSPDKELGPGESTRFLLAASGVHFGEQNGVCTFPVRFGKNTTSLRISTTSAVHAPHLTILEGGVAGEAPPLSFSLGRVHRGQRAMHRFAIFNKGNRDLLIRDIQLPGGFQLIGERQASVSPFAFWWFPVVVDADTPGTKAGDIHVKSNDPVASDFSFPVSATVVDTPARVMIGVFRDGLWQFDRNRDGEEIISYQFGQKGDVPLTADWNGDGITDLCVCRPAEDAPSQWLWTIRLLGEANDSRPFVKLRFGPATHVPFLARENGLVVPVLAGFEPNGRLRWQVDSNRDGTADESFIMDVVDRDSTPVVGDLDGDGTSDFGYVEHVKSDDRHFRRWIFPGAQSAGLPVFEGRFGEIMDRPIVGDWDGDDRDNLGVVRRQHDGSLSWYFSISPSTMPEHEHSFGNKDDVPVVLNAGDHEYPTSR